MSNSNCLRAEEMAALSTVFVECLDKELSKINEASFIEVKEFISSFCIKTKVHVFFTDISINTISEEVFSSVAIRDFILCLKDQFFFAIALSDLENRSIEYSMAYGIGLRRDDSQTKSYTAMPERVKLSLEENREYIYEILMDNSWMTILLLLYFFYQKSAICGAEPRIKN